MQYTSEELLAFAQYLHDQNIFGAGQVTTGIKSHIEKIKADEEWQKKNYFLAQKFWYDAKARDLFLVTTRGALSSKYFDFCELNEQDQKLIWEAIKPVIDKAITDNEVKKSSDW